MKVIRLFDRDRLSNFVLNHPNGNIFQTPEMYEAYKATKNYEPVCLAVEDENEEIVASLLAVIRKEHSGLLAAFSARSIIRSGALIKDNNLEILDFILKGYNKIIKRKAIYTQFRNMREFSEEEKQIFAENGFIYEEHLDIIVDLSKTEEELKNKLSSNRGYGIRRAKREGLKFSVENSIESLKVCYNILEGVYSYAKLPIPNFSLFKSLFGLTNNDMGLKFFTVKYKNEIVGCMLTLFYKNIIYDYFAGSLHNYYNKYPNDLVPWEVFVWAKKNNFKIFDFGGAGKPDEPYGVRDYKKQFGGKIVEWGRFEKLHKPMMMKIGKFGFKIWQKTKR